MSILATLFGRRALRHYALLDDQQRCAMMLTAEQRPQGERWVEIAEIRLGWLGKPEHQFNLQHHEPKVQA